MKNFNKKLLLIVAFASISSLSSAKIDEVRLFAPFLRIGNKLLSAFIEKGVENLSEAVVNSEFLAKYNLQEPLLLELNKQVLAQDSVLIINELCKSAMQQVILLISLKNPVVKHQDISLDKKEISIHEVSI